MPRALSEIEADSTEIDDDVAFGAYAPRGVQAGMIGLARNSFLGRGKARHLMTRLIMSLGGPLDIRYRDCNYRIEGRNNSVEYGLLLKPKFNGPEIDFLVEGLPEGGKAVDVGCNIGAYSLPLARAVGEAGRVLSIDANGAMTARLRYNARISGLANITTVGAAVGDQEGSVDLRISKDDVAIVKAQSTPDGAVPQRTLAALVHEAGFDRVDVLKIDIEGFEDKALVPYLDGASPELLPARIVIERPDRNGDYPGCAAAFARHGYRLIDRTRSNSLYLKA
ncbi:MAG: FkbM family methyltransferase [Paracoccaceae bacterium]